MDTLLGLLSLCALSLFLTRFLRRNGSLMPLLAVSLAGLWFTLFGVLNLLPLGGFLWYGLCLAALVYTGVKVLKPGRKKAAPGVLKQRVLNLLSPGLVFFALGGAFFCLLFFFTRPMLIHWDEFTFWGTAAKVTGENGQLYTLASSNLIARSYPPGLIVQSYMMQFWSFGFAEYKLYAAYAVLYLACLAPALAAAGKNRALAAVLGSGLLFLLFLFETLYPAGQVSTSYAFCLADPALGLFFGGALCFYFFGGKTLEKNAGEVHRRDGRFFLAFGVILCALVNIKDIGFAFALLCLLVAAADMLLCQRGRLSLGRVKGLLAGILACLALAAGIALLYLGWALHLGATTGVDRFDLGNAQGEKNMFQLLLTALGAFLGINPPEKFTAVAGAMWQALFDPARPVSLFGPAWRMLAFILLLLLLAWLLCLTRPERRRLLVFAIASTVGFVLFYLFNIFTYTFVFSDLEGLALKDYHRYIYPYFAGWLMCAAAFLARRADTARLSAVGQVGRARINTARLASISLAGLLLATPVYYGRLASGMSNFLHVSPSLFTTRLSVQELVTQAYAEGMTDEDVVYLISQDDDGTRFYQLGFELNATLVKLFGTATAPDGSRVFVGQSAAGLAPADGRVYGNLPYPVECTPEELTAYLAYVGATHVLLDSVSPYILEDFAFMFEGGLPGWTPDGWHAGGNRYYRIVWEGESCRFVPQGEGGQAE